MGRWRIASVIAAVAVAAATVTPSLDSEPPVRVHDVRLAAATAPPLGAIPLAFIRNQFQYCSLICPYVIQGAVTVPVGAALSPVRFVGALTTTGSLAKALGTAAASVTGPANAALTPIIENDVYRVVPKAFNALEVTVVEVINVASAVFAARRTAGSRRHRTHQHPRRLESAVAAARADRDRRTNASTGAGSGGHQGLRCRRLSSG